MEGPKHRQQLRHRTVDHVPVYPREVIKRALMLNASALILIHNHPSGDSTPSEADLSMTKEIQKGCKYLGLTLLTTSSSVPATSFPCVGSARCDPGRTQAPPPLRGRGRRFRF